MVGNSSRIFHFSLGPVQSFVAQARRTRDFWAGSFLLSYLSAVAMAEVEAQGDGHKVLFPRPDRRVLDFLHGRGTGSEPDQGSVPNRFAARIGPGFEPQKVLQAVRQAWFGIADTVWYSLPPETRGREKTSKVWRRQVGTSSTDIDPFWRMQWALVDDPADTGVLDRRKNLRIEAAHAEPGVKCMLMDGWQELSGADRPSGEVAAFWNELRRSAKIPESDLRDGEHLCAFAFIKRRFHRSFPSLQLAMPSGWTAHGWRIQPMVPSVTYLAAAPWLAHLIPAAPEALQRRFQEAVNAFGDVNGEWRTRVRRVMDAKAQASCDLLSRLDGDLFYDARLANPNDYPDRAKAEPARRALRALCESTNRVLEADGAAPLGEPSPFYAVVAMDGDRLGQRMSHVALQQPITEALETFTSKVPQVVHDCSGFLIYAGGDDVLALFPAADGLPAALALRQIYAECFREAGEWPNGVPTLSGAVIFPHVRLPLGRALEAAQEILKNQAKKACGRNAIAAQVIGRGGERLTWSLPWSLAIEAVSQDDSSPSALAERLVLDRLADEMLARDEAPFAVRFFFRLRRLFDLLNPSAEGLAILTETEAIELMTAEYLDSGLHRLEGREMPPVDVARARVTRLLDQCRPRRRDKDQTLQTSPRLEADGALLVKFLAQHGRTPA